MSSEPFVSVSFRTPAGAPTTLILHAPPAETARRDQEFTEPKSPVDETHVGQVRVTERGQMSLPAQTRHRWGLDHGGEVGWVDLGDVLVLVPGGATGARAALPDQLTADD